MFFSLIHFTYAVGKVGAVHRNSLSNHEFSSCKSANITRIAETISDCQVEPFSVRWRRFHADGFWLHSRVPRNVGRCLDWCVSPVAYQTRFGADRPPLYSCNPVIRGNFSVLALLWLKNSPATYISCSSVICIFHNEFLRRLTSCLTFF